METTLEMLSRLVEEVLKRLMEKRTKSPAQKSSALLL
jgi:hypothetical protein